LPGLLWKLAVAAFDTLMLLPRRRLRCCCIAQVASTLLH
jgi:hypothetical protein